MDHTTPWSSHTQHRLVADRSADKRRKMINMFRLLIAVLRHITYRDADIHQSYRGVSYAEYRRVHYRGPLNAVMLNDANYPGATDQQIVDWASSG